MSSSAEHLLVTFQFITCCFTLISVFVTNAFLSTASHIWNVYKDFSHCTIFSWETSRCLIPSSLESFLNNFECWDWQFRLPHTKNVAKMTTDCKYSLVRGSWYRVEKTWCIRMKLRSYDLVIVCCPCLCSCGTVVFLIFTCWSLWLVVH